jgi:uncharacterized protein YkwD
MEVTVFDPVSQFDPGETRPRGPGRRRARPIWRNTAWRLAIAGLAAAVTLFALLITNGVHESARSVADPAASASSTPSPDPSTSDGGVSGFAQIAPSDGASAAPSPSGATGATPSPARSSAGPASGNASYEDQVATLVNQERAKAGCKPLTVDSRLVTAARGHSQDMATRNYFDHNTPEGVTPWTRITNAGYRFSSAAENIASGQATPATVMTAWMNSPGHRANILNCNLRNIGVGLAYNAKHTPYWTQDFGTPS